MCWQINKYICKYFNDVLNIQTDPVYDNIHECNTNISVRRKTTAQKLLRRVFV